jgi:hypothetical protein
MFLFFKVHFFDLINPEHLVFAKHANNGVVLSFGDQQRVTYFIEWEGSPKGHEFFPVWIPDDQVSL